MEVRVRKRKRVWMNRTKVNKREEKRKVEREGSTVEGGQEVGKGKREGISPWFKRSCAHRERALLGLCRGRWGRWKSGGLRICVSVHVCFLCVQYAKVVLPYSIFLSAQT